MSRRALAASLFALVLVAGVLAPRLRPNVRTVAAVQPVPVAMPIEMRAPERMTEPQSAIPEMSDPMPPRSPSSIIPEATEPLVLPLPVVPQVRSPEIILPEAPINEWDNCPACGMG